MVHSTKNIGVLILSLGILLGFNAQAGRRINCNNDTQVDIPMTFKAEFISEGKLKLVASGGSDRHGPVFPARSATYTVVNSDNVNVGASFMEYINYDDATTVIAQGFIPGQSYNITLTSQDSCLKYGQSTQTITMPLPIVGETNKPIIELGPETVKRCTFGISCVYHLRFFTHDDTSIAKVETKIDGLVYRSVDLTKNIQFWLPDTIASTTPYIGEQTNYYYNSNTYRGNRLVEITLTDIYGNSQTYSKTMYLP
jgi:hypothetical protein